MAYDPNDHRENRGGPSGALILGTLLGLALIIATLFSIINRSESPTAIVERNSRTTSAR